MPIGCHMCDLGFSDSETPASKGPAPKPTHIEHFFHWQRIGEGGGAAAGRDGQCEAEGAEQRGAKWKGRGVPGQQRARSGPEPL